MFPCLSVLVSDPWNVEHFFPSFFRLILPRSCLRCRVSSADAVNASRMLLCRVSVGLLCSGFIWAGCLVVPLPLGPAFSFCWLIVSRLRCCVSSADAVNASRMLLCRMSVGLLCSGFIWAGCLVVPLPLGPACRLLDSRTPLY